MATEKISLTKRGDDYVLSRVDAAGETTSLVLVERNLVAAAQSIQKTLHHILADNNRDQAGSRKSLSIPVRSIGLHESPETSELLMKVVDDLLEIQTTYALPLVVAQDLAHRLPPRVATLAAAANSKK